MNILVIIFRQFGTCQCWESLDTTRFFYRSCYPLSFLKTLKGVSFFRNTLYCELVTIDMCNCLYGWTKNVILDLLFFLASNSKPITCVLIGNLNTSYSIKKSFSHFTKKLKNNVKEYDTIGVIRYFDNNYDIGLSLIQFWIIGLEGHTLYPIFLEWIGPMKTCFSLIAQISKILYFNQGSHFSQRKGWRIFGII